MGEAVEKLTSASIFVVWCVKNGIENERERTFGERKKASPE